MTTTTAAGAPAPAAAAAAPAAAAASPAPAAPAAGAPAAAPAASPAAAPAAAPAATPDYKWAGDETAQQLAQKKGWAQPGDAIKSYTELEGLLGGEKLPLPKSPDDKAGWDRVYTALGRPDVATPEAYGIKLPEGVDPSYANGMAKIAHENGVSAKAMQALAKANDDAAAAMTAATQAETTARIDGEIAAVKDNWGNNFNTNSEIARRGADSLGLTKVELDALEESPKFGHKKLMDMLLKVGQAGSEASFKNPGGGGFTPVTKESAKARLAEIKANPIERSEALKPGTEINKEVDRLDKIIAGVRPDAA